jgi:hypothetical protein
MDQETATPSAPDDDTLFSSDKYALESKSIREALFSVSIYNGESQSVEAFLHEVTSLFRTVKMDEEIFTRLLIINRLTGQAREAFDNGNITTNLVSFAETLRQRFKQTRSYEALTNQRARMVQKDDESILEFTTRFKKLQRDIILSVLNNDSFSSNGKRDLIGNEETLNCLQYVRGLLPEVRDRVQPLHPKTIEDAYILAQQSGDDLSLNQSIDSFRLQVDTSQQLTYPPQDMTAESTPEVQHQEAEGPSPTSGQQQNHSIEAIRRDSGAPGGSSRFVSKNVIKCFNCGGPHIRSQCPTRQTVHFLSAVESPNMGLHTVLGNLKLPKH